MDYFKVFLEAYSEHHGRQLKLLEGDQEESEGEFQARVGKAVDFWKSSIWPTLESNPKGKVYGFSFNAQSKVASKGFGAAIWNGQTFIPDPNRNESDKAFKQFIGSLAGKTSKAKHTNKQAKTETQEEELPWQLPLTEEELRASMLDGTFSKETTKAKVRTDFDHIGLQIQKVWDKLPDHLKHSKYSDNVNEFRTYFLGARHQSLHKQLTSPKFSLSLVDDTYRTVEYALGDDQLSRISDTLRDLVDIIAKGECDENNEVVRNFSKSQNADIVVAPKGDPDKSAALAFPTSKATGSFLNDLLSQAADICGSEVTSTRVTAPVTGSAGSSNNIRGVGFEIFELIKSLAIGRLKGGAVDALVKKRTAELVDDFAELKEEVEKVWLNKAELTAMDPEDKQELLNLAAVLQDGEEGRILLASMSTQSTSQRNPMLSLPVGDQVGKGKRQDILEFYNTKKEAEDAAARSGLIGVAPTPGKFGTFFSSDDDDQDIKNALLKDKVFKKNQQVFTLKVSLKNYLSLAADHPAKFGGGRYSTFKDLLTNILNKKGESVIDPVNKKFIDTISDNLGIDETQFKDLQAYSKKLFKIGGVIFATPKKAQVEVAGEMVEVDNGEVIATAILDKFKEKGFKTILGAGVDDILQSAAKVIKGKISTPEETKAAYERIQIHLNDRLQTRKLQKDLDHRNPSVRENAQRFLAYKMFHAGGSDDDNLICDYRGLKDKDNFIFKQNDPLRDAWASIKNKDKAWSLDMTDSGQVKLTKNPPSNPPMTITMKSSIRSNKIEVWDPDKKKKVKKTNGYSSSYIVEVSRGVMESYSKNDNTQEEIVEMRGLISKLKSLLEKVPNWRV